MREDQTARNLHKRRQAWRNRGLKRPEFAIEPDANQESVWDYPRPPVVVPDARRVTVDAASQSLVDTIRAVRVLETASPPTFYFAPDDVNSELLIPASGSSHCEWKGPASYWSLSETGPPVGWSYPEPYLEFAAITGWFSFYPALVNCEVDGEVVRPQPGGFYGGWLTDEIVGPVKGEPGSLGW